MKQLEWHRGPPPHVGWWNASKVRDVIAWRWWSGTAWSVPAYPEYSMQNVWRMSRRRLSQTEQRDIEWTWHWPENARVERIAPWTWYSC